MRSFNHPLSLWGVSVNLHTPGWRVNNLNTLVPCRRNHLIHLWSHCLAPGKRRSARVIVPHITNQYRCRSRGYLLNCFEDFPFPAIFGRFCPGSLAQQKIRSPRGILMRCFRSRDNQHANNPQNTFQEIHKL